MTPAPDLFSLLVERSTVMNLKESFRTLLIDEQGAELAEYAVGVALLVAVALVVYKTLGNAINDKQSGTAAKVGNAVKDSGY